jgi:hypothetical protein
LALNQQVPTDPLAALGTTPITKLQQSYWTVATPMETEFASNELSAVTTNQPAMVEMTQPPKSA